MRYIKSYNQFELFAILTTIQIIYIFFCNIGIILYNTIFLFL